MFQLPPPDDDPRALSQSVVQAMDFFGLYRAELARILGLQCADVGDLACGASLLAAGSAAGRRGALLVRLFRCVYRQCDGDPVAVVHWLRVPLRGFGASPHQLMVDDGRLEELLAWLEGDQASSSR